MDYLIRFRGTASYLRAWRRVVRQVTGRAPSLLSRADGLAYTFTVRLSSADRSALQALWTAPCGRGTDANGRPYRWNDCVGYTVVPAGANPNGV